MPNPEIKTRLTLDGEREYRAAMRDVTSALKELDSEQRLAQAEFELSGDAQTYAASKADVLSRKIAAQEKAVAAAQKAIAELTRNGVDPSSQAFQSWKTKLNNANTKLVKLKSEAAKNQAAIADMAAKGVDPNASSVESWKGKLSSARSRLDKVQEEAQQAADAIQELKARGVDPNSDAMQTWRSRLADAQSKLDALESELGDADSAMGTMGDAAKDAGGDVSDLSGKANTVKNRLDKLEDQTGDNTDAFKDMATEGIDPDAQAADDLRRRVNTLRARLDKMDASVDDTTGSLTEQQGALDSAAGSAGEYAGQLQGITKQLSLENVSEAISKVDSALTGVIRTAARAAKAVWKVGRDSGEWAQELQSAAQEAGVSASTYQSWDYAASMIGASVNDIVEGAGKITQAASGESDEVLKIFNQLGVANRNATGGLRDSNDLFWATIDALGRVEDATQREYYAQKLFGESARKFNPLIEAGSQAFNAYAEEGGKVAAVSDENVAALVQMNQAFEGLEKRWEKAKQTVMGGLAPAFTKLADKLSTVLERFTAFLETEEGQQKLDELGDTIGDLIDAFLGENSFQGVLDTAKDALTALNDALKWISDNKDGVVAAINVIGGALAALKVAKGVTTTLQLFQGVKGLLGGGAASCGASAAPAVSAAGGGASSAAPAVGAAAAGKAAAVKAALSTAAQGVGTIVGPAAAVIGGVALVQKARDAAYTKELDERARQLDAAMEKLQTGQSTRLDRFGHLGAFVQSTRGGAEYVNRDMGEAAREALIQAYHDDLRNQQSYSGSRLGGLRELMGADAYSQLQKMVMAEEYRQDYAAGLRPYSDAMDQLGQADLIDWTSMYSMISEAVAAKLQEEAAAAAQDAGSAGEAAQTIVDDVTDTVGQIDLSQDGLNIDQGLANAIDQNAYLVANAMARLVSITTLSYQRGMRIASPSKVMAALGKFVPEGIAVGIDQGIGSVERAMGRVVDATTRPVKPQTSARQTASATGAAAGDMRAVIVMDGQIVGELVAPWVQGEIAAQVAAQR